MNAERWQHFHDVMGDIGDSYVPDPGQRSELVRDVMEAAREVLSPCPAPVDWPARFRTAGGVADAERGAGAGVQFRELAIRLNSYPPPVVEAIGRALLGEESQ